MRSLRNSVLNQRPLGRGLGLGAWAATLLVAVLPVGAAAADASEGASDVSRAAGESLQEIVVTARKRAESLQDAPISISAFSASDLESRGAKDLVAIANFTPNLTVQNNPGNGASTAAAAVYLRGVGQDDFAPTLEPGVGIYVDGIYLARTVGALLDVVDIEGLEVLRGPQGTLFGRNTIGGAISITTKKPEAQFSGLGEITVGTDQRLNGRAALNFPLAENLFARISVGSFAQDGYVERTSDGRDLGSDDTITGRAALRWIAGEDVELNLAVDGTRDRESGAPYAATDIQYTNFNSFIALNNVLATGDPVSCFTPAQLDNAACYNQRYLVGRERSAGTFSQFSDLDLWGVSLTADVSRGNVALKSISAYRDLKSEFARDADGSDLVIAHLYDSLTQRQVSQEFQALGTGFHDRVNWIVGLYYFEESGDNLNLLEFRPANLRSGGAFETRSWAAFSQATLDVSDRFAVTVGLRYTDEEKQFTPDSVITAVNVPPFVLPLPPGTPLLPNTTGKITAEEWTPLLSASFHWTKGLMTYVSYSEGFKSGGFTQRVFPPEPTIPTFDPEFVQVYELGFKLTSASSRLRVNGAAFHTQYDDLQVLTANLTRVGPFISNAAKAEINGFELELAAIPADGWQMQLGVGYLDPGYEEIAQGTLEISADHRFRRISDRTISGSASKDFALAGGTLAPRVDWSYHSSFYNDAANTPELRTDGYHLLNAGLSWQRDRDGLSFAVGVENLLDERYLANGFLQPNFGVIESLYDRGRQWHVTVRKGF